jgi:hypothetical protein
MAHRANGCRCYHDARILGLGTLVSRRAGKRGSSFSGGSTPGRLPGGFDGSRDVVMQMVRNHRVKPVGVCPVHWHLFGRGGISDPQRLVRAGFSRGQAKVTSNNAFESGRAKSGSSAQRER